MNNNIHNPDVLSCLANLSSDEVFTPPEIANAMLDLLPQELFSDPSVTFLDPCCKSGVFLREIAKRLNKGLEAHLPNREERLEHIFRNQLFGIAITELTSLLARRGVYFVPNTPMGLTPSFVLTMPRATSATNTSHTPGGAANASFAAPLKPPMENRHDKRDWKATLTNSSTPTIRITCFL